MRKPITLTAIALLVAAAGYAGGPNQGVDLGNAGPTPIPGHTAARVVSARWDTRSIPIRFSMNDTLNPIPNPIGAPFLSLDAARASLQTAIDTWNALPSSYIDMKITGTRSNPGVRGFDFVNELTFRSPASFGAMASSNFVSLVFDTTFGPGDDIDGDGDSDVAAGITVTTDADHDGDLELPPGFYKAGTVLDNDVQFNTRVSNGYRFTVGAAAIDDNGRSADLLGVALHEFGHVVGLTHSVDNQISEEDATGSTMFPTFDPSDPETEASLSSLTSDDIAWASYFYPEGSASSGPAALQPGDVAFDSAYGLIQGEIRHGAFGEPLAGANVVAYDWKTGALVGSGYSGTTQYSRAPNGGLWYVSPEFNIIDGKYTIPVPKGNYSVGVEPVDNFPASVTNVNLTTRFGWFFGQMNFNEEFYNNNKEGVLEVRPGQRKMISVQPGKVSGGVDITTGLTININNFGAFAGIGFFDAGPGLLYAMRIPASQIAAVTPGEDILIHGVSVLTWAAEDAFVAKYARFMLTTGVVDADGTMRVDLANPLDSADSFVGQGADFANLYFHEPHVLGKKVRSDIAAGAIQNLFIVLEVPTSLPFPGVLGYPPMIGVSFGPVGMSHFSNDGGATWRQIPGYDWMISLLLGAKE